MKLYELFKGTEYVGEFTLDEMNKNLVKKMGV